MKNYNEYDNYRKLEVDVPGLSSEMTENLEELICEFEENHANDMLNGGDGFVPRLKKRDLVVGTVINGLILVYYIGALIS